MQNQINEISLFSLSFALIPVVFVFIIYTMWSLKTGNLLYSLARMLIQLLMIGYVLTFLFQTDNSWLIIFLLTIMLIAASWIALGPINLTNNQANQQKRKLFSYAILSILAGGGFTLFIITQGVLQLKPWFMPQYMIPLAGMVFASAMTSISLVAERFQAEWVREGNYTEARNIAFQASMIPMINSLFAVGLVALPGMMTGQILSGVDPLIAVRYQIMVMLMLLGSSGISAALFLTLAKSSLRKYLNKSNPQA